ncbi:uncharacterized protein [Porites lutea]|uniref:uncharacterized protein n=1 Tax=Porites lutea TaxID=51062 RepID=UPI003CC69387
MGCNQSKVRFSQVFKRKRATKRTTWYVDLGTLECSPPLMQHTSQKPAPASNIHYEDFSILSFMTRKDHYEWVEMYAKKQLFECVESCLNYKGFHEYGFHLLSLTPRPLLEIRTYDNRSIHSLPGGNSTALEYFLRTIPEAIEAKVGNDPFVLVIDDLDNESGYSKMCVSLIEKTCQTLQMRFEGRLKRVCINRPYGLLAYDLAIRKRFNLPFASCEIENKLIVADRFSVGKLARATGFPGRLIPEDELKTRVASL